MTNTIATTLKESYDNIIVDSSPEGGNGKIAMIKLNRPKALNALNDELFTDLIHATNAINNDTNVQCLILTGSTSKAFAAGADISEMKDKNFEDVYENDMFAEWQEISKCSTSTPIIASVSGYCLGGGNELAMMCDIMVCTKNAKVRITFCSQVFVLLFCYFVILLLSSSSSSRATYLLLIHSLIYSVYLLSY
jgi:enoyl-CoA hydratase/carnithine racemase